MLHYSCFIHFFFNTNTTTTAFSLQCSTTLRPLIPKLPPLKVDFGGLPRAHERKGSVVQHFTFFSLIVEYVRYLNFFKWKNFTYRFRSFIHAVCGFSVLISALFFFLNLIFLFQRGLVFFSRYDFYQCFFSLKVFICNSAFVFFLVNCPIALSSRTDFGRSTDWNNYEILVFVDELKMLLLI